MAGSTAEPQYQRLTWAHRRGTTFVALSHIRSSLWLASDHLLSVESTGYTEKYKRFYFRDIQAIILLKTDHGGIRAVAFASLMGLFALFAFVIRDPIWPYVLGLLAGLCALGLVLQLAAGPTCLCHLRTAVQTEELPALSRLRRARKVLVRLRPLVAAAQGELSAADVAARLQETRAAAHQENQAGAHRAQLEQAENPVVPPIIES